MEIQEKILTVVIIATVMYMILNIFLNQNLSAGIAAAGSVLTISTYNFFRKKH